MIESVATAWLYAYSPTPDQPQKAYHTVFVSEPRTDGREVLAQTSLSHLTTMGGYGAGAWILSYVPPFGPAVEFHDFKFNSVYAPNALSITFGLSARAAESYSLGTIFFL
jgi:hypothetical protein